MYLLFLIKNKYVFKSMSRSALNCKKCRETDELMASVMIARRILKSVTIGIFLLENSRQVCQNITISGVTLAVFIDQWKWIWKLSWNKTLKRIMNNWGPIIYIQLPSPEIRAIQSAELLTFCQADLSIFPDKQSFTVKNSIRWNYFNTVFVLYLENRYYCTYNITATWEILNP